MYLLWCFWVGKVILGPVGTGRLSDWAACYCWISLAGSSCLVPFLLAENGILRPIREGECFPWLFVFGEAYNLSPLLVVSGLPDVVRGTLVGSWEELAYTDCLLFPDWKLGKVRDG